MKAHLNNAALAISKGVLVGSVIEELLSEGIFRRVASFARAAKHSTRKGGVFRPSSNIFVSYPYKANPNITRYRVPGGAMGIGAVVGAGLKGYLAHRKAKEQRLKGKAYAKYLGKNIIKGAAGGALAGYAFQLRQRSGASKDSRDRHLRAKAEHKWYRTRGRRRARKEVNISSARSNLQSLSSLFGIGQKAVGL